MPLANYVTHINPTEDQLQALKEIETFLKGDTQVFILKGYAGTGKTSLLRGVVAYLEEQRKPVNVMAPTGAAARILNHETGYGVTIHRGIYNLDEFKTINDNDEDIASSSYHYDFPIIQESQIGRVGIVDEASMISDAESRHELFKFGTDRLLSDLLTYMNLTTGQNKLLLVGDPAQLEPVTDSNSKALQEQYFKDKDLSVASYTLTKVVRQKSDSSLLNSATRFRGLLNSDIRNDISLEFGNDVVKLSSMDVVENYLNEFPKPQLGKGVIITYSNRQSLAYNQKIRSELFPGSKNVTDGDLLIINKNNYHTHGIDLYNGMVAKVLWASPETEVQAAPVYIDESGRKVRKIIKFRFRDVTLNIPGYDQAIQCKIIDSLLNGPAPGLTIPEMKALYINFKIRFGELQQKREQQGKGKIITGSEDYKELMWKDPYFNALHVKYGYSITCHKAQGGEWETAFVNFQNRVGIKDPHLRWCYTAMTRAKRKLYAINPPDISPLGTLQFSNIMALTKLPDDAIQYNNVPETPYHDEHAHPAKKLKYFEIEKKLTDTPYSINRVESRDWHEMYYVNYQKDTLRLDIHHNKAGRFKNFTVREDSDTAKKIEELFNEPNMLDINVDYDPSNETLKKLYSNVLSISNELNIQITNVVEKVENYYVLYYFQLEGHFASIQFYINSNQQLTKANPKLETADEAVSNKFQKFINKLQS